MKRLIALSILSIVAFAPAAYASHGEEADGCDHGATSKPCRPDPSPHGQDCDVHGNHGGVNEDHCTEETTTSSTTTSTTATTSTSTTGPSGTTTTTAVPTTPDTTTPSVPTIRTTEPVVPSTTSTPATIRTTGAEPVSTVPGAVPAAHELPRTGWGSTLLVFFGLWCLLGGVTTLALAQLIRGAK